MKNSRTTKESFHSTTVICVRRNDRVAMAGDGQVSLGNTILKRNARKIRHISDGEILAGFAGSTADAFTLFELFEKKVNQHQKNISRAAVELARDWRTDRMLRRLEALLVVADKKDTFLISGTGDVIAPDDGIVSIGSGGNYALAAARALYHHTDMSAREIAEKALLLAGEICIYTNQDITLEEIA